MKADKVRISTWANNIFLRGEAEAKITLLPRNMFNAGRFRGRGIRGRGACGPLGVIAEVGVD